MTEKKDLHYRYNLFYIFVILISSVIILITIDFGSIKGLAEYILFGLTLTSFVLSSITIIYSLISNTSFSKSIGIFESQSQKAIEMTARLSSVSDSLEKGLTELPTLLKSMEDKFVKGQQEIMESVQSSISIAGEVSETDEKPISLSENAIKRYLDLSSFNGKLALYTCQLAYKTKKPFDIQEVWTNLTLGKEYGNGYLISAYAAGVVDFSNKDNLWNITGINEHVPDLKPILVEWLKKREKKYPDVATVEKLLEPIEFYFKK